MSYSPYKERQELLEDQQKSARKSPDFPKSSLNSKRTKQSKNKDMQRIIPARLQPSQNKTQILESVRGRPIKDFMKIIKGVDGKKTHR